MSDIDVGNPQLSMHSIRETAGVEDVKHAIELFEVRGSDYSMVAVSSHDSVQHFFTQFATVDAEINVD